MTESLAKILENLNIKYELFSHPPVFTCEEANQQLLDVPGSRTKNLFLTTKTREQFFLVTTCEEGQVNLKALANVLGVNKLSFANAVELNELLGISPGCVSLLALSNDKNKKVSVYVDQELWGENPIHCHPLVNSKTLLIVPKEIERIFKHTGHTLNLVPIPKMEVL